MFQAPDTNEGKQASVACLLTDQPVKTEQQAKVNKRMTDFFRYTVYKPNVVIVDNAGRDSIKLKEQIINNFYK